MVKELLIDIRSVTAYRGGRRVLSGFSFQLESGVHTAILGPNGSGKSTLLQLAACELYPVDMAESSLEVFGRRNWDVNLLRRRQGIISHDMQSHYLPGTRGLDVVLSGARASIGTWAHQEFSADEAGRAEVLLKELGLDGLRERRFGDLSTGEQRRFILARALFLDPELLLFDEPTSGLDLSAALHYLKTLRRLMQREKTVLLVTHHVHEIPPEIGRVVHMKEGRIVADGPKEAMLTAPRLSELFDVPLRVAAVEGWYQVFPGE